MGFAGIGFASHPRGLAALFMTELWERFSYYGMRALLVLYLTAPALEGGLALTTPRRRPHLRQLHHGGLSAGDSRRVHRRRVSRARGARCSSAA